jgi:formate dehydrogenase subunit beta
MSKLLKIRKSVDEATRSLLESLLKEKKVRGVITLKKVSADQGISYSLITQAEELKDALPLFPLMPANGGKILSHLTLRGPVTEPLAALVKPCELRAFVELVKREQGSLENFLIISQTCPGVYPLEKSVNGNLENMVSQYWNQAQSSEIAPDIRPACKSCLNFVPSGADMTVSLIGEEDLDKNCHIYLNSEKGEEFAEGVAGEVSEQELKTEKIDLLMDKRKEERDKLFEQLDNEAKGIEGIVKFFGKCIGCHGCGNVCPLCYCDLCFFESQQNEPLPVAYESEAERKGGTRVPAGTIFYHLGRLAHMSVSCTGCGMCADVCPVNIPVSTIFSKVGESVQKAFDYSPGLDVEEPVPFSIYKEEEFTEIGEQ